ncbi:MAG: hydrogenase maturation nickel metallochaperone HypA [bacterium]
MARSMLDVVLRVAEEQGAGRVTRIVLAVGREAGVVPDCLCGYFDTLKAGTLAESAELVFREVPLVLRCPKCGREFAELGDICGCNAGAVVLTGRELTVESIEIESA